MWSPALHARQQQALERRLAAAADDRAALLVARRGKGCPTTPDAAQAAIDAILQRHDVVGLLAAALTATTHTRPIRAYRDQPARQHTTYTMAITSTRVPSAITTAVTRLGGGCM